MNNREVIRRQIQVTFQEIEFLIRLLYSTTDIQTKNLTLNQLWNQISFLHFLVNMQEPEQLPLPPITREQLSQFTGKGGHPAYVAVNGVVYDVTNNKAWSLASHFGLNAGQDLTKDFSSCHEGQERILQTLTPVGRLV